MTSINNKNFENKGVDNSGNNIKRWSNIIGLSLLTIGLMIIFKQNSVKVDHIENKILKFYTNNLQPLFVKTEITNEDIFNFAIYQNLPIDKNQNKVLEIAKLENNEVNFQVKNAVFNKDTKNYQKFIEHYQLTDRQQKGLDSILLSYKNNVYASILTNDKQVVAVDPKIVLLRESLIYDISTYLENQHIKNFDEFENLYQIQNISPEVQKIFVEAKLNSDKPIKNSYLFFAKDSVYKLNVEFNSNLADPNYFANNHSRPNSKKEKVKVTLNNNDTYNNLSFGVISDSIIYQTGKIEGVVAKIVMPVLKNVGNMVDIEISTKNNKKIKVPELNLNQKEHNFSNKETINFDINIEDFDFVNRLTQEVIDEKNLKSWVQFGIKMDSLSSVLAISSIGDSGKDLREVKKELRQLKIELQKLKKQNLEKSSDKK